MGKRYKHNSKRYAETAHCYRGPAHIIEHIQKEEAELQTERKKLYEKFLRSKPWKDRKDKLFIKYGSTCEICNSDKVVQVHHNNYRMVWGQEKDKDLIVLCKECHNLFHSKSYLKDSSWHASKGYWHKGHFRIDPAAQSKKYNCSICTAEAKYSIFREGRRHILFCLSCTNIFKCKLDGSNGEELKTGMPVCVSVSAKHKPTVHRRRGGIAEAPPAPSPSLESPQPKSLDCFDVASYWKGRKKKFKPRKRKK